MISFSVSFWSMAQNRQRNIFKKLELNKIGFADKQINQDKFWKLNEIIKTKKVDNWTVNASVSEIQGNHLKIEIPLKWRQVDKTEFGILESEFKLQKIELDIGCIVKLYNIKMLLKDYDLSKFDIDILDFITLTKSKGFDPEL